MRVWIAKVHPKQSVEKHVTECKEQIKRFAGTQPDDTYIFMIYDAQGILRLFYSDGLGSEGLMRTFNAGFDEVFDTFLKAYRVKQRALARREVVRQPAPTIFVTRDGRYRLVGDSIVRSPWNWSIKASGAARERLIGTPIPPPRPKHRKGKRSRYLAIKHPMFPHP